MKDIRMLSSSHFAYCAIWVLSTWGTYHKAVSCITSYVGTCMRHYMLGTDFHLVRYAAYWKSKLKENKMAAYMTVIQNHTSQSKGEWCTYICYHIGFTYKLIVGFSVGCWDGSVAVCEWFLYETCRHSMRVYLPTVATYNVSGYMQV